jgi:hypothetical protein
VLAKGVDSQTIQGLREGTAADELKGEVKCNILLLGKIVRFSTLKALKLLAIPFRISS